MKVVRTFHPVGHGAFFVERFYFDKENVFNVVYDCGDNKTGLADKAIIGEFGSKGRPIVDILFISHFDSDHVSAFSTLARYMTALTKVFMPFFSPHYANVLYGKDRRTNIELILSMLGELSIRPIMVRYSESNEEEVVDLDNGSFPFREEMQGVPFPVIRSGSVIQKTFVQQRIWKYVPFNLFNEEKLFDDFSIELKKLQWPEDKIKNPSSWDDADIKELRKKYHILEHSINDNSLIILSMPLENKGVYLKGCHAEVIMRDFQYSYNRCRFCDCSNHSCLYTGDTVLKRGAKRTYSMAYEKLLDRIKIHTNKIGMMQIPHHGSGNNINMATLVDSASCCMFANYSDNDEKNQVFLLTKQNLKSVWKPIIKITETSPVNYFELLV